MPSAFSTGIAKRSLAACAVLAIAHAASLRGRRDLQGSVDNWSAAGKSASGLWGEAHTPEPVPEPVPEPETASAFNWASFSGIGPPTAQNNPWNAISSSAPASASASASVSAWATAATANSGGNRNAWPEYPTTQGRVTTVAPFNCSGLGSMPIQVMAKDDQDKEQGYDVKALDFVTGAYTTLYTIPNTHVRIINSAAINPLDGIAYATAAAKMGVDPDDGQERPDTLFFVRFDAHRVEFIAALGGDIRRSFTAAFTPSGDYILPDNGQQRLFVFGADAVVGAAGFSDPTDAAIPRWSNAGDSEEGRASGAVREVPLFDASTGKAFTVRGADIAILQSEEVQPPAPVAPSAVVAAAAAPISSSTNDAWSAVSGLESPPVVPPPPATVTRTYAVDISSNSGEVNLIDIDTGKVWSLAASEQGSAEFIASNKEHGKWHGAAWNFGNELYFANNGGGGVFQLVKPSIDLAAGAVQMRKAGLSDASNSNDGMNCWVGSGGGGTTTDPFKPTPAPTPPAVSGDDDEGDESESGMCSLPAETGRCKAHFLKWHFSPDDGACKQFIWGGCGGNSNRFDTQQQCEARCAHGTDEEEEGGGEHKPCKQHKEDLKRKIREARAQKTAARAALRQKRALLAGVKRALQDARAKNAQARAEIAAKATEAKALWKNIAHLRQTKDSVIGQLKNMVGEKRALIKKLRGQLEQAANGRD